MTRRQLWLFILTLLFAAIALALALPVGAVAPGGPAHKIVADGFDWPIGTAVQRRGETLPTSWYDANPFAYFYHATRRRPAYHTGADLNLRAGGDSDYGQPVYAPATGTVVWAINLDVWGNVVVIRHDAVASGEVVYSRYGHLGLVLVEPGQWVTRGAQIGTVGKDAYGGPAHLHFDISPTEVLRWRPGDWPGRDLARLLRDYVDPLVWIKTHRPAVEK